MWNGWIGIILGCVGICQATAEEFAWQDFERVPAATLLDARGPVRCSLEDAPAGGDATVKGKALRATATGRAMVMLKPDAVPLPKELATLSEVCFWVHRPEGEDKPVLEIQFREEDLKAWYWRMVVVEKAGWNRVSLPLRYFRTSSGRNPQWQNVRSMVFFFRDKSEVSIDGIAFSRTTNLSADLAAAELAKLAFEDTAADKVRAIDNPRLRLLTNAPELDVEALQAHLLKVLDEIERDLPFLPKPRRAATLIVFATDAEYREFPARFAAKMDSAAAAPTSDGFTLQAIATSAFDVRKGSLRPVYSHELVHSFLELNAALPDGGDWVHEGLASLYQLRLHPQADMSRIVRQGLAEPAMHAELAELCSGKRIATGRYWQAMTVWTFLLSADKYREKLPQLFEHFGKSASTDLGPALKSAFNTDWPTFSAEWKAFCEKTYAE